MQFTFKKMEKKTKKKIKKKKMQKKMSCIKMSFLVQRTKRLFICNTWSS